MPSARIQSLAIFLVILATSLSSAASLQAMDDPQDLLYTLIESENIKDARQVINRAIYTDDEFDDFLLYLATIEPELVHQLPWHSFRAILEKGGTDPDVAIQIADAIRNAPALEPWSRIFIGNRFNLILAGSASTLAIINGLLPDAYQASPKLFFIFAALYAVSAAARTALKIFKEIPVHDRMIDEISKQIPEKCNIALAVLSKLRIPRVTFTGRVHR